MMEEKRQSAAEFQASTPSQTGLVVGAAVVALACLGGNMVILSGKGSVVRKSLATAIFDPGRPRIDGFYTNAPAEGHVLLRFHRFTALDNDFMGIAYFRSAYLLYPQKVYATEATNVVNHGSHILYAPLHPSESWMDEHSIRFVLDLKREANGGLQTQTTIRKLPAH